MTKENKMINQYKIKQTSFIKDTVIAFGKNAYVEGNKGVYTQGKYEANNKLALFIDDKTNTLYRVPLSIIQESK
jgi:hypothetical protein